MHGWLVVDKPIGLGSTQAVAAVKRALREGGYPKLKVGHGGTLDPLASGVLPVAIGEATKLAGRMLEADKVYEFTIRFGEETDTLDAEGAVVARSATWVDDADVEDVLVDFEGTIEQAPPAYSALKVAGKRSYDLARSGAEVIPAKRRVTVHEIHYLGSWREDGLLHATLRTRVSKGTYIRSLARDIARALDSVGYVTMLRRLKAGPFTLAAAISLDKIGELAKARQLEQALLPLTAGLDDIPALPVTPDQARALREGRGLAGIAAKPGLHLAIASSVPVALVELREGCLRVVRGFNI
jgi:tRNA pseudouridine55 synthase